MVTGAGKSFVEEAAPSPGLWEGGSGLSRVLLLSELPHILTGAGRGNSGAERFRVC